MKKILSFKRVAFVGALTLFLSAYLYAAEGAGLTMCGYTDNTSVCWWADSQPCPTHCVMTTEWKQDPPAGTPCMTGGPYYDYCCSSCNYPHYIITR